MIDWFTVVAQILNFLILVVLLKYLLYGRIMNAMESREKQIQDRWDRAEQSKRSAAQHAASIRKQHEQLDRQRENMLAEMRVTVASQKQELTGQLRNEIDTRRARWVASIQKETESFLRDLGERASRQVWHIAKRALADLADGDLERQIVATLVRRIGQMSSEQRQAMIAACDETSAPVLVRSAFKLPDDLRQELIAALADGLPRKIETRFEVSTDCICGIEVHAGGNKLAWEIRNYLDELKDEMERAIREETAHSGQRADKGPDNNAMSSRDSAKEVNNNSAFQPQAP